MVLEHSTNHTYSHPFSTVTLAYFLRYSSPRLNPFASHVLSTDTIERYIDPETGRLHTTRLHLKKSRIPGAVFKLLPSSMTNAIGGVSTGTSNHGGGSGTTDRSSYILETSVVDMKEGWFKSESRNLNYAGVLSVVERQTYSIPKDAPYPVDALYPPSAGFSSTTAPLGSLTTNVTTTISFQSRLGERLRGMKDSFQSAKTTKGWLESWGTRGIQRSIESLASTKAETQLSKSREGMRVVLERLRSAGGVRGVLEMLRRENQTV